MKKHLQVRIEPTTEPTFIDIVLDKKPYSEPKLYIPKEEINGKETPSIKPGKRWYVWFLWRTETGKLNSTREKSSRKRPCKSNLDCLTARLEPSNKKG